MQMLVEKTGCCQSGDYLFGSFNFLSRVGQITMNIGERIMRGLKTDENM